MDSPGRAIKREADDRGSSESGAPRMSRVRLCRRGGRMTAYGTSLTSRDVRLRSAKRPKRKLVAVTNRDLSAADSALALPAIGNAPQSRVATGKAHPGTPPGFPTAWCFITLLMG